MRIFIARHGQVLPTGQTNCAFDTSRDDPALTPLGEKQAALLGEEMRRSGFRGKIISSPFSRTLNTAAHVARALGLSFLIDPRFREIVQQEEGLSGFEGKNLGQMKALFPEIAQESLPYPWWTIHKNSMEEIIDRVRPLIKECLSQEEDCLLIGHGASTQAAVRILLNGKKAEEMGEICRGDNLNCSLSEFSIENGVILPVRIHDHAHLPAPMFTSNQRPVEERNGKICIVM